VLLVSIEQVTRQGGLIRMPTYLRLGPGRRQQTELRADPTDWAWGKKGTWGVWKIWRKKQGNREEKEENKREGMSEPCAVAGRLRKIAW
jgi:hypothetical protein